MKRKFTHTSWQRTIWVWILLGVLAAGFTAIHQNFAQDDAYITYRYARNISEGRGFVYNPGEPVLGTTTPLFTIILAVINYLVGIKIEDISIIAGALSLWVSAGVLYLLGKKAQQENWALAIALIYLTNPFLRHFIGMESYFLLGMLLLTNYAYVSKRYGWASLLGGLLILIRYEMVFFIALMGVHYLIAQRKLPLWLWPSSIPILVWCIYSVSTFGSPIPLSASAKLLTEYIPFPVGAAAYWYSFVVEVPILFVAGIFTLVGFVGYFKKREINQPYLLLSIFGIVYFVLASFLAGSFPWYYAPLTPLYAIAVGYGIKHLSQASKAQIQVKNVMQYVQIGGVGIVLISQLLFWRNSIQNYQYLTFDQRISGYQDVSDWLLENSSTTKSIAVLEIGYIGYYTNMQIIDLNGLVTPGLLPWVDDGPEHTLYHSLNFYSPDWVLIPNKTPLQDILNNSQRYNLRQRFGDQYLLYEKVK